ncbi:MAG TPA: alpha/beta hydrolase-fold protein [Xanthobacteraceae bacterium]|nr:alpha/beta hydrolase-fold protein [Xanthobacteraceae bacterium]
MVANTTVKPVTRNAKSSGASAWGRTVFALAGLSALCGAAVAQPAAPQATVLPDTEQRTIVSKAGHEYRIFIIKPKKPAPESGYPVLYALDGNSVVALLSNLNRGHLGRDDQSGFVPGLVVAVGYPTEQMLDVRRRALDYTAAQATPDSGTYLKPEQTGGADAFLSFLEEELKPAIEREFRVDKQRQALFGHSFGGLFTLHTLFTKPDAFQTYIAASPSIWWADRAISKTRDAFIRSRPDLAGKRILLLVGGLEQELAPYQVKAKDAAETERRLRDRRMVSDARELRDRLLSLQKNGLEVSFEEIANETHMSVMPYAAIKAFRFAFRLQ